MNKIIKKLFLILPILLVVLSLSGCDMKEKGQGKLQEFDLNGTKVSFVPPQGWECGVFPWENVAMRGRESVICAEKISVDIMNEIGKDYVESKGSGPYYDEIVKNNFGEAFLLYPENSSDEEIKSLMNKEKSDDEYSKTRFIKIEGREFRSTIVARGRKNASTFLLPYKQKIVIMTSVLPEDQTATLEPTEKVRQILETILMEEGDE